MTHETSEPTAAGPTAACQPVTGRTPSAWSAGLEAESQSATFRALAWSQDDFLAEPLPYTGEEYSVPEVSSPPAVPITDADEPASEPRYRPSMLLYGIAAGFVAAAIGGLVLTVVNTDALPTTTSPVVIQPAKNAAIPQPGGESGSQGVVVPSAYPAPVKAAGSPAHTIPPVANTPADPVNAPAPTVAPVTPAAPPPPAAEVTAPEVAAPAVTAPVVTAPEVRTPEVTPAAPVPPPAGSPPPAVSLPEVTPQQVPHPMGPIDFHAPVASEGPFAPIPNPAGSVPPVFDLPAAPAAPNQGITLKSGFDVPLISPTLTIGSGQ